MEKKSRLRAPNFTHNDCLILCDLVYKYKNAIENKKTDGASLVKKQEAWLKIGQEFNAQTSDYTRTVKSLQQNYKNLKKKAKKNALAVKMEIPVDGSEFVENMEASDSDSEELQKDFHSRRSSEESQEMFMALAKEEEHNNIDKCVEQNIIGTGKRKLDSYVSETTVNDKYKALATEKMECVLIQKEILKLELVEAREKLEHNRALRAMEAEDAKLKYEHNVKLRKLELKQTSDI